MQDLSNLYIENKYRKMLHASISSIVNKVIRTNSNFFKKILIN